MTEKMTLQRTEEQNLPFPPVFSSLEDVRNYLVLLYNSLKESQDRGLKSEVFMGTEKPASFLGKDGDFYIEVRE